MRKFEMPKNGDSISPIGERLRFYRKRKNLTLKQMSALTGISQPTLSEVENGHYDLSGDKLGSLVRNTDIDLNWLLTGEGEMCSTPEGESAGESHLDTYCCVAGVGQIPSETKNLVSMAVEILASDTKYARLLAEQIRSLHESIQFTKEIERLKDDLAENREMTINLVERMAAMEIAERERLKMKGRREGETPLPESLPEENQKTAG
jgi:transcriptional regulator with XRE-family HTH domain